MEETEYLKVKWYAKIDDLIGGWCVGTNDITPANGGDQIADFLSEEIAKHVVLLHNTYLENQK